MIDLGSWNPFTVETVQALVGDAPITWWLSGGHALDRFVGEKIREHGDLDVSLARADWSAFLAHVDGMLECFVARHGVLSPARAELRDDQYNIWTREVGGDAWRLQVNLEPVVDGEWTYRRDGRVHRPLTEIVWHDNDLAVVDPAVQLLWKAKAPTEKDEVDRAAVLPRLDAAQRAWLAANIELAHPTSPWRGA